MVGVESYCKSGSQWWVWGVTVRVAVSGGCLELLLEWLSVVGAGLKSVCKRWVCGVSVRVAINDGCGVTVRVALRGGCGQLL